MTVLDALAKAGVAFIALKENIRVEGERDIQTKVMTTLFALFADVEHDLISERTREASPRAKSSRASETWSHDDVASGSIRPHRELPPSLAERRPRDRVVGEDRVPTSLRWVPLPVVDHAARESAGRQRSSASSARTSGVEVSEQAVGRASVLRRAFVGAARQPQAPGLRRVAP